MSTALFAFDQPAAARRAAERLQHCGLPNDAVRLHLPKTSPGEQAAAAIDEQATGGLLTNVFGLFGELLEWGSLPIDASPFAAIVRRGGALVSVATASPTERSQVDAAINEAEPSLRSAWFDYPGEAGPASAP
jgi:hypothetical protein